MVITERQGAESSQTDSDRIHRRMVERIQRVLNSPRLSHQPTSEWNLQLQTLRNLERNSIDMRGPSSIFQLLFQVQSVFDSLNSSPNSFHFAHPEALDQCTSDPFSHGSKRVRHSKPESETDIQIIPVKHLGISRPPVKPHHNVLQSLGSGCSDKSNEVSFPEAIEYFKTKSSKCQTGNSFDEVIDCDSDTRLTDSEMSDVQIIESDLPTEHDKSFEIVDADLDVQCLGISECNATSSHLSWPQRSIHDDAVCKSANVLTEGNADVRRDSRNRRHMRVMRSNKDTLVGGANKVLAEMGPGGYYKGDNQDILPGATYLSDHKTSSNEAHSYSDEEKPVNQVPNYPIYSFLKKKLIKECRQIDHIKGDGNCFFRALSKQLYGSEKYHIVLRNLIVDIIATNKDEFSQFVDGEDVQDHVERMSQEQSWATTCEIYAAATLLQRDIFMLTPDHLNETYSWLLFKPVFQMDTQNSSIESHPCYMTLCNTNGNHYDRVVAQHGACNCFLPHPELGGVSYSVDLTCEC